MMEFRHEPVLLSEVLTWIRPAAGGVYLDGTLGGGGHSEAILRTAGEGARLYGIDRDTGTSMRRKDCWRKRAPRRWTARCWIWGFPAPSWITRSGASATTRMRRWICGWTGARDEPRRSC